MICIYTLLLCFNQDLLTYLTSAHLARVASEEDGFIERDSIDVCTFPAVLILKIDNNMKTSQFTVKQTGNCYQQTANRKYNQQYDW
jgi:hypothetical protein